MWKSRIPTGRTCLYDNGVLVQSVGAFCLWEAGGIPAPSRSGDGNERHEVPVDHTLPPTERGSDAWQAALSLETRLALGSSRAVPGCGDRCDVYILSIHE